MVSKNNLQQIWERHVPPRVQFGSRISSTQRRLGSWWLCGWLASRYASDWYPIRLPQAWHCILRDILDPNWTRGGTWRSQIYCKAGYRCNAASQTSAKAIVSITSVLWSSTEFCACVLMTFDRSSRRRAHNWHKSAKAGSMVEVVSLKTDGNQQKSRDLEVISTTSTSTWSQWHPRTSRSTEAIASLDLEICFKMVQSTVSRDLPQTAKVEIVSVSNRRGENSFCWKTFWDDFLSQSFVSCSFCSVWITDTCAAGIAVQSLQSVLIEHNLWLCIFWWQITLQTFFSRFLQYLTLCINFRCDGKYVAIRYHVFLFDETPLSFWGSVNCTIVSSTLSIERFFSVPPAKGISARQA